MKHKIAIVYTEVDSGDCELGCWNTGEGLLMGSYRCQHGYASFYDHTLRKAIEKYEMESK